MNIHVTKADKIKKMDDSDFDKIKAFCQTTSKDIDVSWAPSCPSAFVGPGSLLPAGDPKHSITITTDPGFYLIITNWLKNNGYDHN